MNIFNIHAQHKIKHFDLSVRKIPRMHALELALSQPETIQPIIVTAAVAPTCCELANRG